MPMSKLIEIFIPRYCHTDGVQANPNLFDELAAETVESAVIYKNRCAEPTALEPEHLLISSVAYGQNIMLKNQIGILRRILNTNLGYQKGQNRYHNWRDGEIGISERGLRLFTTAKLLSGSKKIGSSHLFVSTVYMLRPDIRLEIFQEGVNLQKLAHNQPL